MKRILILMLICSKLNAQFDPDGVVSYPYPIEFQINKFPFNVSTGFYWNKSGLVSTDLPSMFSFELSNMIRDVEQSSNKFLGIETGRDGCYRRSVQTITLVLGPTGQFENFEKLIDHKVSVTDLDTRRLMVIELLKLLDQQLRNNLNKSLRNVENVSITYEDTRIKNSAAVSVTFSFIILEKVKCPDSN